MFAGFDSRSEMSGAKTRRSYKVHPVNIGLKQLFAAIQPCKTVVWFYIDALDKLPHAPGVGQGFQATLGSIAERISQSSDTYPGGCLKGFRQ